MKSKAILRILAVIWMACALSGSIAFAQTGSPNARAAARPAARPQAARRSTAFQSDRTDSWLCIYVSPFFCSNLYPTLGSGSGNSASSSGSTPSVPDRSRH